MQWDEAVMMPAGAAESRGKQKSALAGVVYEKVRTKMVVLHLCLHTPMCTVFACKTMVRLISLRERLLQKACLVIN